jgi:outer membrane immunogenic protein
MSVAKCVRTGAAVLGVLFMAEAAHAADPYYYGGYKDQPAPLPQALPAPFWQGFYAGGNIGGLWSAVDAANNVVFVMPGLMVQANQSVNVSGLFGGAQTISQRVTFFTASKLTLAGWITAAVTLSPLPRPPVR